MYLNLSADVLQKAYSLFATGLTEIRGDMVTSPESMSPGSEKRVDGTATFRLRLGGIRCKVQSFWKVYKRSLLSTGFDLENSKIPKKLPISIQKTDPLYDTVSTEIQG